MAMHCNLRPPDTGLPLSALITTLAPRRSWSTYLFLTYYVLLLIPYTVALTFDPLTLDVCNVSAVTWSNIELNFGEIELYAAELSAI